ncbi:MAG: FecR family protein [Acetatifactor sp.]|nr:FecR family protein [Acetatifactor sp.]
MSKNWGKILLASMVLCVLTACSSGKGGKTEPTGDETQAQEGVVSAQKGYETTAISVELSKTEGDVGVSNKSGNAVKTVAGMHLYNGNKVTTNEGAKAYLTLDDSKAAKLSEYSALEVRKETKDLTLYLSAGEMFFNVAKHLEDDESMNVRTSTMVTGIRGTSGFVRVIDFFTTEIYILDGEVTVTVIDPVTGATKTATVKAGEMATSAVFAEKEKKNDRVDVIVKKFTEEEVPAFVIEEVSADTKLQTRLVSAGGISSSTLTGMYQEAVTRDRQRMEKRLGMLYGSVSEWNGLQAAKDEMFDSDSMPKVCELTDPTLAQVQEALDDGKFQKVIVNGTFVFGDGQSGLEKLAAVSWSMKSVAKTGEVLTVPDGKDLNLNGKTAFGSEGSIDNYGTITNNGALYLGGVLSNIDNGKFINNGTIVEAELAHEHVEEMDPAVEPTCTEDGLTEGSHCSICGEILVPQKPVKAKGHTVVKDKAVKATCGATGLTEGSHCSVCNEILVAQEVVPATEKHKEVKAKAVAASCTKSGLTEGITCSVCKKVIKAQEVIPAKGHTSEYVNGTAATCTRGGTDSGHRCSTCGTILDGCGDTPALGHLNDVTLAGVAPVHTQTQLVNGLTEGKKCSRCGATTVAQQTIPAQHTMVASNGAARPAHGDPTCTADGWDDQMCSTCGLVKTTQIPAKGHVRVARANDTAIHYKEPDCTEAGYQDYWCSVCHTDMGRDTIPALGHVEVIDGTDSPPTCGDMGYRARRYCSRCNETLDWGRSVPPTGDHHFVNGKCTVCGADE